MMKIEIKHTHRPTRGGQEEVVRIKCDDQGKERTFASHGRVGAYEAGVRDAERVLAEAHAAELESLRAAMLEMVETARTPCPGVYLSADRTLEEIATAIKELDIEATLETRRGRRDQEVTEDAAAPQP